MRHFTFWRTGGGFLLHGMDLVDDERANIVSTGNKIAGVPPVKEMTRGLACRVAAKAS